MRRAKLCLASLGTHVAPRQTSTDVASIPDAAGAKAGRLTRSGRDPRICVLLGESGAGPGADGRERREVDPRFEGSSAKTEDAE